MANKSIMIVRPLLKSLVISRGTPRPGRFGLSIYEMETTAALSNRLVFTKEDKDIVNLLTDAGFEIEYTEKGYSKNIGVEAFEMRENEYVSSVQASQALSAALREMEDYAGVAHTSNNVRRYETYIVFPENAEPGIAFGLNRPVGEIYFDNQLHIIPSDRLKSVRAVGGLSLNEYTYRHVESTIYLVLFADILQYML